MSRIRTGEAALGLCLLLLSSACVGDPLDAPADVAQSAMLTVAVGPTTAAGIVASGDGAIRCNPGCWASYAQGTAVTLTATADPGWKFDHWAGDCAGTSATTRVTLEASKVCDAFFVADARVPGEPSDAGTSATAPSEDAGSGAVAPSDDSGATSLGVTDAYMCCAPQGSKLSYAACPVGGDKCCIATTAVECESSGGSWTGATSCSSLGPSC